ncbi:MAG: sulfatase [Planctomycetota bacterium]|nr:sulfatase [Planctomycetota bacterium]
MHYFALRVTLVAILFLGTTSEGTFADKPNIIVIFTDDQGYNDLGCFGSPNIKTPNIDQLAKEGMRLTSFYSGSSVCTPSRAALLTGCYPERVGNLPVLFPNSDRGLSLNETTIAELLKSQGYATACFGKWHLGHHAQFLPTNHGFDEYFGVPYSNDMGIDPGMKLAEAAVFREGKTREAFLAGKEKLPPLMRGTEVIEWPADQTQLTQRYTSEAKRFIRKNGDRPFFIYLPHTMPHIPLFVSDRFRGQSDAGLYGDTLEEIDWSVGEIVKTLKEQNIEANTLIVYTSDNGPWNLKGNDTDKMKGNMNRRIGGSAFPLRGHKFSKWEGGLRVPCVVHWPSKIAAGAETDEIIASIDLLPTFAALSGAKLPAQKIDGVSAADLLLGKSDTSSRQTYFYRNAAVRKGDWKFVENKLFNLKSDIGESKNLADKHPAKLAELKQLLADHQAEIKSDGRSPAYHERAPYPFPQNNDWTVHRGRWSFSKEALRQRADWNDAKISLAEFEEGATIVQVEIKVAQGSSAGLVLQSRGRDLAELRVLSDGSIRLQSGGVKQVVQLESKNGGWRLCRLVIDDSKLIGTVDKTKLESIELTTSPDQLTASLITYKSQAQFRNFASISADGRVLVNAFKKD